MQALQFNDFKTGQHYEVFGEDIAEILKVHEVTEEWVSFYTGSKTRPFLYLVEPCLDDYLYDAPEGGTSYRLGDEATWELL